jgi:hypothetical protein
MAWYVVMPVMPKMTQSGAAQRCSPKREMWWLLCEPCPMSSTTRSRLFLEPSFVSKNRVPMVWPIELTENAAFCTATRRTTPPHTRPESAPCATSSPSASASSAPATVGSTKPSVTQSG